MPVNTSSTGATYGKSSDPLCPLGFHPQVRWPTRCKRCFRDYKEHSDDNDKAKFRDLSRASASLDDTDPWSTPRTGFQRARSLDVNIETSTSRFSSGVAAPSSSYASRTTTTSSMTSKSDDDIPEWKKSFLEKKRLEEESQKSAAASSSTYTSRYGSTTTTTSKAAEPSIDEDYASRRRRERAAAAAGLTTTTDEPDWKSSLRSRSVQPDPTPAYDPTPEMRAYERYQQRKSGRDEEETKPSSSTTSSTSYTSSYSTPAKTTASATSSTTSYTNSNQSSYGGGSSYGSQSNQTTSSYGSSTSQPSSGYSSSSSYNSGGSSSYSSPSTPTSTYGSSSTTASTRNEVLEKPKAPEVKVPSWKSSLSSSSTTTAAAATTATATTTTNTPSWKRSTPLAPVEEKPKEVAQPAWKKQTPSWKAGGSTLGKISETSTSSTAASTTSSKPSSDDESSSRKSSFSSSTANSTTATAPARKSWESPSAAAAAPPPTTTTITTTITKIDTAKVDELENEVKALKEEISTLKQKNNQLVKDKDEIQSKKPLSFETAKASEMKTELLKAKEKIRQQENDLSSMEKEKKGLQLKLKETEALLEKRPQTSETSKNMMELQTKLKFLEKKCSTLEAENDRLHNNVQNLEGELEEVQDNFREDEMDEYRTLKRDLENQAKNVRVLQFKLKKAERTITDMISEKSELETKLKSTGPGTGTGSDSARIRLLEKELEQKTQLNAKYEQQIAELKGGPKMGGIKRGGAGPVLSRTGSVERNVEDQLLKDLQDSIERENDLKEQLNMAEEQSNDMRKKLSRLEDENESLAQQVKKMTIKSKGSRRSPSPAYGGRAVIEKDEGISEDGEELSASELKVQLEVSEGETGILRKKVENLLTENLKLSKDIKELNTRLTEEKKKKSTPSSFSRGPEKENSFYEDKIDDLQSELNGTRVKLIEKEREVERLDAQLKAASKSSSSSKLKRTGSQDDDLLKKLEVIEKEASVLRDRVTVLEGENERLASENKKKYGSKPPSSTTEKLQMDKFALEGKVKELETKIKEQTKKITDLTEATNTSKQDSYELDRLKREKNSIEMELTRLKANYESDKRKTEKMERELAVANEKSEKAQRELIAAEREKRRLEEDKRKDDAALSKLESDHRMMTRERDRYKDEAESARQKNRDNLQQTQEGIKAFKDQIETLKSELQEEKNRHKETKKQTDDKIRQLQADARVAKSEVEDKRSVITDLESKVADLDDKWTKSKRINQQRKDKMDALELQVESLKTSSSELETMKKKLADTKKEVEAKEAKIAELERSQASAKKTWGSANSPSLQTENEDLKKQIDDLKKRSANPVSKSREIQDLKQEMDEKVAKYERLEEEHNVARSRLAAERDEIKHEYNAMKKEYETLKGELAALRTTYNTKNDEWIKEKLDVQHRMKDLEESIRCSAGEGWDTERERFKHIIDDRDNQITQLKIECDVARSQVSGIRKECDDLKLKLIDYEKMSKFQKVVSNESSITAEYEAKLEDLKKQLSAEQRERKSEVNNVKMKYDSRVAIMNEEIVSLKSQCSKYRRERESYKEMYESAQKTRSGRTSGGDEISEYKAKVSDLQYQVHVLEDELAESKLKASKSNADAIALKSNYEIQISELNSKINELEEEALIESGRARIAGTRTKMELAWQKERDSQKKLINELNTMARDLKSTLLEVERERDRERLESKRKLDGMKGAFEEEQEDTKKQITDLQYDLLELRDAHAKLRTTNEKLRRDKEKLERERDEFRSLVKERSRTEQDEDKKISRLVKDMDEFLSTVPKLVGDDISKLTTDSSTKNQFKDCLKRMREAKDELEQMHRMNEEEREKMCARRAGTKRLGSVETEGGGESPHIRGSQSAQRRPLYRKTVSVGDTIAEADDLWKSHDSRGSNESLASNASIPLPIPVRTRSAHGGPGGGSESGYSSDTYNAMNIKRLERDTSVDRMSTGSRESNRSTQSEWVAGEKKKKSGLIGKLKKLTRKSTNPAEEKEFGSGSDISSVSIASSSVSAFQRVQQKRAASQDRSKSKERGAAPAPSSSSDAEKRKPAQAANDPFEKYFVKSEASGRAAAASSQSSSSTLPRYSRPF